MGTMIAIAGAIGVGYIVGMLAPLYWESSLAPLNASTYPLDECRCGLFDMSSGSKIRYGGRTHTTLECGWDV